MAPSHNGEIVKFDMMTRGVRMVIDRGRYSQIFIQPFPKGPCRFPYILFITLQPIALVPLYYCTFLCDVSFSLGATGRLLIVLPSLNLTLMLILPQMFLKISLRPLV